jgi:hypothetical protein
MVTSMARMILKAPLTLEIHVDMIDVTMGRDAIDFEATVNCGNGHAVHMRRARYVVDASHWCDGTEGAFDHDPHETVDQSHYECPDCSVVIEPVIIPAFTPRQIPGVTTATIFGTNSDGFSFSAFATQDEVNAMTALLDADYAEQQRFIDSISQDRWTSWRYTSN